MVKILYYEHGKREKADTTNKTDKTNGVAKPNKTAKPVLHRLPVMNHWRSYQWRASFGRRIVFWDGRILDLRSVECLPSPVFSVWISESGAV
jgi:hypothetical protein